VLLKHERLLKPSLSQCRGLLYQLSKFSFSCVSVLESVLHKIDEIVSHASACKGDNALFTGDKKKFTYPPSCEHVTFGQPKTAY